MTLSSTELCDATALELTEALASGATSSVAIVTALTERTAAIRRVAAAALRLSSGLAPPPRGDGRLRFLEHRPASDGQAAVRRAPRLAPVAAASAPRLVARRQFRLGPLALGAPLPRDRIDRAGTLRHAGPRADAQPQRCAGAGPVRGRGGRSDPVGGPFRPEGRDHGVPHGGPNVIVQARKGASLVVHGPMAWFISP